jgi:NAD(P)-dependent dehydrogenase (short-subunit alcohol dehydrogenase family)
MLSSFARPLYNATVVRARVNRRRRQRPLDIAKRVLRDKIALVTGGNTGIGLAIATELARAGADCIIVAIDQDAGNAKCSELALLGLQVDSMPADSSDAEQVRALALEVGRRYSKVDILVNNAGVFFDDDRRMRASVIDARLVERTLAVNLYGTMYMCAAFSSLIPAGGRIINISSVMGQLSWRSTGEAPAYRMSKAALNSYTQSLAAELKGRNVMVDCLHPGWVKTAIGGPDAKIDPVDATETVFFLATRAPNDETGLFWEGCRPIAW